MASVEYYSGPRATPLQGVEGATQTFKKGDLVQLNTSGYVVIAATDAITGIACQNASGTTAATIEWEPICFDAVYSAHYKASATAQSLVGDCLDFTTLTVGAMSLDESGATTDVYCVGLDPRDPVTTSGGRLLVKFYTALGDATGT